MASFRSTPLLEKQRIFHSRDLDEARAFLGGKEFRFDLSRRAAKQLDMRINGIYLPSLYIGYIQYGSPAEIRTNPARNDYSLHIPIQEHIEVAVAPECIACGPDRAPVSSPPHGLFIRTTASASRFHISLNAPAP